MAKSLVIVESPAKAKTINRYLGKDYVVKSSIGHIRDLPVGATDKDPQDRARKAAATKKLSAADRVEQRRTNARAQLVHRMGVDPDHGWAARYEILPGKEKVVEELRRLARDADHVYLATDRDREGEAIAWHLQQTIGGDASRFRRVVFNEITQRAIREAFEQPAQVDTNQVNAQQARRFLDRVVGFEVSPLLWAKVARGLSAGRVQSVAVRLIVEREREIRAFQPEEFWEVFADLHRTGSPQVGARFQVVKDGDETFRPASRALTDVALAALMASTFEVASREDRPTTTRPGAPFITSTLQQAASTRLGFSVKKTMTLAQRLYEAGYITYMRTDSTSLSQEAVAAVRDYLVTEFGPRYLPPAPLVYAAKADAQQAHEAIRPSNVGTAARALAGVDPDAVRLYDLIWRQFVACQMPRAEYTSSTMLVQAGRHQLRTRGRILRFDGFTRVQSSLARGEEDVVLPDLRVGETLQRAALEPIQHFTRPPPRFGEASLVRELEKRGIGRPSTYANIISTVQERGYVTLLDKRFHAEKIGELVTDRLTECFENLMDYGFTARLEDELDDIARGRAQWKTTLDTFYQDFSGKLAKAQAQTGGMRANDPTSTDIPCPTCGRPMQIRTGGTGVFLGCSGYNLAVKERCTKTMNLIPADDTVTVADGALAKAGDGAQADAAGDADAPEQGDELESALLRSKRKCPRCGTVMDAYLVDESRKLHICGNGPDCPGFEIEAGQFRIKGYEGPTLDCDKCGAQMQLKTGRFGRYFGCTDSTCKNTRKLLRSGAAAPPRTPPVPMPELRCAKVDDHFVLRDGAAGLFLAASQFPKNRETRAPLVLELAAHGNELDPKYRHITEAPRQDPQGNPAVVRFSRKTGEHYVTSEAEGKATSWRVMWANGKWLPMSGAPPLATAAKRQTARGKTAGRRTRKAR